MDAVVLRQSRVVLPPRGRGMASGRATALIMVSSCWRRDSLVGASSARRDGLEGGGRQGRHAVVSCKNDFPLITDAVW